MPSIAPLLLIPLLLIGAGALAETSAPYAGQQQRAIKALSASELRGLESGAGLGMAKAAELNHYPGPLHALELAEELQLNESQRQQIQAIYQQMKVDAIKQGKKLIDAETALDRLFANGNATREAVERVLAQIGTLRAQLRGVHLNAHVALRPLLSDHQVARYDQLRGYTAANSTHHHKGHGGAEHHHH